ncbi:MAG: bifunctional (p)ppGpp synthetase/guanosine-3',5'-bis(diphosphate) 3'-pyrophosphohydrolase [Clostridiales bacterium]|nr:bifunctional (p)ppGpp synthetase/guanosine-3',5'-bis(diphosphate) 3'-pyrophosphohydrolase [Clostridiales bacterium]
MQNIDINDDGYSSFKESIKSVYNEKERALIEKAYKFAAKAHKGQLRLSGQPFVSHPIAVAQILAKINLDCVTVVAALLHDTVEDTSVSKEEVKRIFGEGIAALVDGVTKLGQVPIQPKDTDWETEKEEEQAENIRKMLLAMSEDMRVILIKLADRLHNMRTISFMPEQKRRDKALETIQIYAPIAHRLGIRAIKEELEDLAIHELDAYGYEEIKKALEQQSESRNEFLENIKKQISQRIKTVVPDAIVDGRIKSVHGIYRKMFMQEKHKDFDEIYDIYAVRIIVDTEMNCYNCLGYIHDMYHPIHGRFKDYISTPKPNMYQSLHTTVIGNDGIPFEVQIRTQEMHDTAEFGIAAHWKYKTGKKGKAKFTESLAWVSKIIELQNESDDSKEILRTIKSDLTQEEVYVFTPRGEVKSLPGGSTVIDFAYSIHSEVGNKMVGAKVDGRIVPIDYKIKNGEIIEVLTTSQQGKGPSRDWLKIVRTSEARNKIRAWYKKERRDENIVQGKIELEREFRRNRIRLSDDDQAQEFIFDIAKRLHFNSIEDFYAAIGYGGIALSRQMPRIRDEYLKKIKSKTLTVDQVVTVPEKKRRKSNDGVIVEGMDSILVKFSKCCNPLPGDEIIGYITRGHGVSIHKTDCNNVPKSILTVDEPERWVKAYWDRNIKFDFQSTILITCLNRVGMLADVTGQLAGMSVMIHDVNTRHTKDGRSSFTMTISVNGLEHMKSVIAKLEKVNGVLSVERTGT